MYQPYERTIGLKTIYLTIIKRFVAIILIFAPIALASFLVTQKFMTKSYTSTATISNTSNISVDNQKLLNSRLKNRQFSYTVTTTVGEGDETEEVKTVYNVFDTASETLAALDTPISLSGDKIFSGVSMTISSSTSPTVTLSFSSANSSVPKAVLDALSPELIKAYKADSVLKSLTLSANEAGKANKTSKENTYMLIGIAAGAVIALALPFIDEIVSDEVYDKKDIDSLGGKGFMLKASKR